MDLSARKFWELQINFKDKKEGTLEASGKVWRGLYFLGVPNSLFKALSLNLVDSLYKHGGLGAMHLLHHSCDQLCL